MSFFNFAISGALKPYQPLPAQDSGVAPVAAIAKVKRLDDREAGKIDALTPQTQQRQSSLKHYSESAALSVKQHRRAWKAEDLMTSPVNTLYPTDPIRMAWDLHHRKGFRHIPIVTMAGVLVGMISDRDLLRSSQARQVDQNVAIQTLMTKEVLTCFPESPLRTAAEIMLRENFSALPIINRDCHVRGIITTSDILQALVHDAPLDLWA